MESGNMPQALFLCQYQAVHRPALTLLRDQMPLDMNKRNIVPQKANTLDCSRVIAAFIDRVENLLVSGCDNGPAFSVSPIDNNIIGVFGERGRKGFSTPRIPALAKLANDLPYS